MKNLYEITDGLLREMVEKDHLEEKLSKYLKPEDCKTLKNVYEQALSSLCNRQGMPKNIQFERLSKSSRFERIFTSEKEKKKEEEKQKRACQLKEILSDFDPKTVKDNYDKDKGLKSLVEKFNNKNKGLDLKEKIDVDKKHNPWVMFGNGAISAAIFLSDFGDRNKFDVVVKDFQRNKYFRDALPMLLAKEIVGFGFALACDFLKESGYNGYAKPDRHLMKVFEKSGLCKRNDYERFDYEVFKTIIEVAKTVEKTPYEVDKKIWLVCTGKFYYDKKVDDKEEELLGQLSE